MHWKLIILFLFFEITIFCATTESIYHNETFSTWTTRRNHPDASFILVNPKRIQQTEVIIKRFLTKLTGPIDQPINFRLSSSNGGSLKSTISEISKIIRANVMKFARASGLTASVRQYEHTLWNSTTSKSWFTEGLIQGSLLLCDLIRIGEEIPFAINHYFRTYNMTLYKDKSMSSSKSFKFFNTVNDATSFSKKIFKCLLPKTDKRNPTSSFNLDRALVNLAKDSPDKAVKSFKSSLDLTFVRSVPSNGTINKQLYMLLCHSFVEGTSHYSDCIKELRRFETCMSLSRDQDSNEAHHRFFVKPFTIFCTLLVQLGLISNCTININNSSSEDIDCKFYRRMPTTTTQQVKYIYEKILDQRISRRSSLHRVANELGNVLSRSRWGRQLTYDVCQYFAIYQEGHRRLNMLSKSASKDKRTAMRYNKMFVSLNMYKNGILKETMLTIGNFHRSALEIQKFLIHGIRSSFKESWHNHYKIYIWLALWLTKLLQLLGWPNLNDTNINTSISTVSPINMTDSDSANDELDENNEMRPLTVYSKKDQLRKEADIIFERLMRSINHVSKMRSRNNSTLACLANNLLLVTMFMETIGFVSTLFCLGEHKDESNTEELAEE